MLIAIPTGIVSSTARPVSFWIADRECVENVGYGWVEQASVLLTESGATATGSASFVHRAGAGGWSPPGGAEVRVVDNTNARTLWGGHLTTRQRRPEQAGQGHYTYCSAVDYSAMLDTQLVAPPIAYAAGFSDQGLVQFLVGQYGGKLRAPSDTVASTNASMPALRFADVTLRQALEQIATAAGTGRAYYVDSEHRVHYFNGNEGTTAPKAIDDNPGVGEVNAEFLEVDFDDGAVVCSVYIRGANAAGSGWYRDSSCLAAYGPLATNGSRREVFLDVPDSDSAAKRAAFGAAFLQTLRSPVTRGRFRYTGDETWRAGQTVTITNAALGITAQTYQIKQVDTRVLKGHPSTRASWVFAYEIAFGALPRRASSFSSSRTVVPVSGETAIGGTTNLGSTVTRRLGV